MQTKMIAALWVLLAVCSAAFPCSTFVVDAPDGPVFARNYDWTVEEGLVIVNPRGLEKRALVLENRPAEWTAEYGSVTFNQYGRELPCGGINEAGLVIEVLWLPETEYAAPDDRPAVSNLQWIQYHLDTCTTTAEVLESAAQVRIAPVGGALVHYLVCDADGNAATVEVLDGEIVAHAEGELPVKALTNSTYADSLAYLRAVREDQRETPGPRSLDRFARAARFAEEYAPEEDGLPVVYAFEGLADLADGDYTKWSMVYDIAQRRVYWRTFSYPQVRFFDVEAFDFSPGAACLVFNMNTPDRGLVNDKFEPYTTEINRRLVFRTFQATEAIEPLSDGLLSLVAAYPETLTTTR